MNMTYIALASFVGCQGSVRKGEIIVINDKAIAEDLLKLYSDTAENESNI